MKNIVIKIDRCPDSMFDYPCIDSNIRVLKKRKISIFSPTEGIVPSIWLEEEGATVQTNPSNKDSSFTQVGIVEPLIQKEESLNNSEDDYYRILDYYIQTLQLLIHKMKGIAGFKHIIVLLPPHADEYSTLYSRMATYAVYGLVKGLGQLYASNGLFINGIILNEDDSLKNLKERLLLLASDNSCNIVGQVFKL